MHLTVMPIIAFSHTSCVMQEEEFRSGGGGGLCQRIICQGEHFKEKIGELLPSGNFIRNESSVSHYSWSCMLLLVLFSLHSIEATENFSFSSIFHLCVALPTIFLHNRWMLCAFFFFRQEVICMNCALLNCFSVMDGRLNKFASRD